MRQKIKEEFSFFLSQTICLALWDDGTLLSFLLSNIFHPSARWRASLNWSWCTVLYTVIYTWCQVGAGFFLISATRKNTAWFYWGKTKAHFFSYKIDHRHLCDSVWCNMAVRLLWLCTLEHKPTFFFYIFFFKNKFINPEPCVVIFPSVLVCHLQKQLNR